MGFRLPMSRLALGLVLLLGIAACADESVRGVDPTTGRDVVVGNVADLPDGFRRLCSSGACGPAPASAGASCGGGRYDGAACLATDESGTSCVWMNVPCEAIGSGSSGTDGATSYPTADAGNISLDAGAPPTDGGLSTSDGGFPTSDGGLATDAGSPSGDAGAMLDSCPAEACAGPAPAAPTCFDGQPAAVSCGPTSTSGCAYLFRCGSP